MSESFVRLDVDNGVARLTLDRPDKRNALTRDFIQQIADAVRTVGTDEAARVLLLCAEGPVFCAGMDLGEMQERAGQPDASRLWKQDAGAYRDLLEALFLLPIPTVAVVQGPVLAGGLGLVLACDVVLSAEEAFFSLPEPKRGITAAVVAPLLIYRTGPGAATYMLLSGRRIAAPDAQRMNLCHEVAPASELPARERELARTLLEGAPSALAKTKQHIISCAASSLFDDLNAGMQVSAEARETDDAREGLAAFFENRKPAWHPGEENE